MEFQQRFFERAGAGFFFFGAAVGLVFLEEEKRRRPVISLEQKTKGLAGFILEQKIGIAGAIFLEQKTEASWLDLYSRFG